jgi:hypothetical protein
MPLLPYLLSVRGWLDRWRLARYNLSEETFPKVLPARAAVAAPLWLPRLVIARCSAMFSGLCSKSYGLSNTQSARIRLGTKELLVAA